LQPVSRIKLTASEIANARRANAVKVKNKGPIPENGCPSSQSPRTVAPLRRKTVPMIPLVVLMLWRQYNPSAP
jgi:hypothetical protein